MMKGAGNFKKDKRTFVAMELKRVAELLDDKGQTDWRLVRRHVKAIGNASRHWDSLPEAD